MAELKLDLTSKATVKAPPPEIVKETPLFKQRNPSEWDIKPGKTKGTIVAKSDMGDKFEGSTAEFSKLLRA